MIGFKLENGIDLQAVQQFVNVVILALGIFSKIKRVLIFVIHERFQQFFDIQAQFVLNNGFQVLVHIPIDIIHGFLINDGQFGGIYFHLRQKLIKIDRKHLILFDDVFLDVFKIFLLRVKLPNL